MNVSAKPVVSDAAIECQYRAVALASVITDLAGLADEEGANQMPPTVTKHLGQIQHLAAIIETLCAETAETLQRQRND